MTDGGMGSVPTLVGTWGENDMSWHLPGLKLIYLILQKKKKKKKHQYKNIIEANGRKY